MRLRLDPLSPNGVSVDTDQQKVRVVQSSNGYIGETKISGLVTAGSNVTITGTGTKQDPYVINSSGGGGSSPLTTKGDLYGYSTTNARIPAGTNGQVLTADSTQTLGLKWAPAADSIFVTVGGASTDYPVANYTDVGAAVNAAYAGLPAEGGCVWIEPTTYSYSTPINFGTNGKIASLRSTSAASTFLKFTPTSGTALTLNGGNPTGHLVYELSGFTLMGKSTLLAAGGTNTNTSVGLYLGGANGAPGAHTHDVIINGFGSQVEIGANAYMLGFTDCGFSGGNGVNSIATTGIRGSLVHINTASNSGERNVFTRCNFTDPGNSAAGNAIFMDQGAAASTFFINCSMDNTQLRVLGSNGTIVVRDCHIEDAAFATYGEYIPFYFDSASSNSLVFMGNEIADSSNNGANNFDVIIKHGVNLTAIGNHINNYGGQTITYFFDHSLNNGSSAEYMVGNTIQGGGLTNIARNYPYTQSKGMGPSQNYANSFTSGIITNSNNTVDITSGNNIATVRLNDLGDATVFRDVAVGRNLSITTGFKLGTSSTSGWVLTTDASGNGTWQAPTGGGSSTDTTKLFNLGVTVNQTANFTATVNLKYTVDATSGVVTATLPATGTLGNLLFIQKSDATTNVVNITGNINGTAASTLPLRTQLQGKLLQWDGVSTWNVIAGDLSLPALDARYLQTSTGIAAVTKSVAQTAHGFTVGTNVYYNGTAYVVGSNTASSTAEVDGMVTTVTDANNFILTTGHGSYVTGLSGLTAGTTYFLGTAGALTATPPTTVGYIRKALLRADSTTSGYFDNYLGIAISAPTSSGLSSLAGVVDYHRRTGVTNGRYYSSPSNGTALTNITPALGSYYAMPLMVTKPFTIDSFSFSLETVQAGSTARIAIYSDDGNLYPNALLFDSGDIVTSSGLGAKNTTPNLAVTAGIYWMVYQSATTAPTIRGFTNNALIPILGGGSSISPASTNSAGWNVAATYGAYSSTFPGSATVSTSTASFPYLQVRFV